jgi:hypothetical protein
VIITSPISNRRGYVGEAARCWAFNEVQTIGLALLGAVRSKPCGLADRSLRRRSRPRVRALARALEARRSREGVARRWSVRRASTFGTSMRQSASIRRHIGTAPGPRHPSPRRRRRSRWSPPAGSWSRIRTLSRTTGAIQPIASARYLSGRSPEGFIKLVGVAGFESATPLVPNEVAPSTICYLGGNSSRSGVREMVHRAACADRRKGPRRDSWSTHRRLSARRRH